MALQDLWDSVKAWVNQPGQQQLRVPIPAERTDLPPLAPLVPHASYFRLWLSEMFLDQQRAWFVDYQPMVHSIVKLKFGDRDGVSLATVAQPPQAPAGSTILLNYKMTELLPFSGMVSVPLTPVLGIAERLATGVQEVVAASNGRTHLAIHDALRTGGPQGIGPGYIVVIRATAADGLAPERFSVQESRLYYAPIAGAKPVPFDLYDYMLFYVETMKERDDWRLKTIQEPLDEAIKAFVKGDKAEADAFLKAALTAALTSPDLSYPDRNRAAVSVRAELKQLENQGLGAAPTEKRTLKEAIEVHAPSPAVVPTRLLTFSEVLGN